MLPATVARISHQMNGLSLGCGSHKYTQSDRLALRQSSPVLIVEEQLPSVSGQKCKASSNTARGAFVLSQTSFHFNAIKFNKCERKVFFNNGEFGRIP